MDDQQVLIMGLDRAGRPVGAATHDQRVAGHAGVWSSFPIYTTAYIHHSNALFIKKRKALDL